MRERGIIREEEECKDGRKEGEKERMEEWKEGGNKISEKHG